VYSGVARTHASLSVYAICLSTAVRTALHCTALHCTAPHCTSPLRTALHCTALVRYAGHVLLRTSAAQCAILVDYSQRRFSLPVLALPAHSPRGSRQGLCNGRAVCSSVCHAASAGLLLSARRTADIDQLLHVASAAGAPCSGAQQQMRAVPR